jgi:nitrite reductase (NADH) small subunit
VSDVARQLVGVRDLDAEGRCIATYRGRELGVFRVGEEYYAYENRCPHAGGPVCQGRIMPRVEAVLDGDRYVVEERFVEAEPRIACPWHGWEFDLVTGRSVSDPGRGLRAIPLERRGDDLYVRD